MNNVIFRNIIRFVVLVLLQVLVFNNIEVFSYITPYIYVLFILLLPFEISRTWLLIIGFLLGFTVDIFSNTGGIHTAATVLMAYVRPWIQNSISSRQEFDQSVQPGINNQGFVWFFLYSLILISIHHVFLFYLESFQWGYFFQTLFHAILNVFFTLFFVICFQYLFYRKSQ